VKILLVDDDPDSLTSVQSFLARLGHQVTGCSSAEQALLCYFQDDYPMVLSDIKMPGLSGLDLLAQIKATPRGDFSDIILFTGHGDIDSAIAALRAGAYDYLLKPIRVDELATIIERVREHQLLKRENKRLSEEFVQAVQAETEQTKEEMAKWKLLANKNSGICMGVFSLCMALINELAYKYHTARDIPVLIQGETGTGKELIARIIHYGNKPDAAPFIDINCAALTPNLFESELFGYEPGSFTGGLAKGSKGKIDIAKGGTLFLDEVAEIPIDLQGKLLRVIQEKEFYRVGGLSKIKTDIRIICATNMDLETAVTEGRFRKDLYYRLKVGTILLPPLRERQEEILPLAAMFLESFSRQRAKHFASISREAEKILLDYSWPGNVRELRNAIEWAVFMHDDIELKPEHLGTIPTTCQFRENKTAPTAPILSAEVPFQLPSGGFSLEQFTDQIIIQALKMHDNNKTLTAQYLGLSRRALCYRLEQIANRADSLPNPYTEPNL